MSNPLNRYIAYQQFGSLLKVAVRASNESWPHLSWSQILPIVDKVQRHPWSGPHNVMVPLRHMLLSHHTSHREKVILLRILDCLLRNLDDSMIDASLSTSKFLNILLHGVSDYSIFSNEILRCFGIWTRDISPQKSGLLHRASKKLLKAGWKFPDMSSEPPMWPEKGQTVNLNRGMVRSMSTPEFHKETKAVQPTEEENHMLQRGQSSSSLPTVDANAEAAALIRHISPYHYDSAVAAVRSMLTLAFAVRTLLQARIFGHNPPSIDADPELQSAHDSLSNAIRESGTLISQETQWKSLRESEMAMEALGWCETISKQAELWLGGRTATVVPTTSSITHFLSFNDEHDKPEEEESGAQKLPENKQIEWSPDFAKLSSQPGATKIEDDFFSLETSKGDPIQGLPVELLEDSSSENKLLDLEQLLMPDEKPEPIIDHENNVSVFQAESISTPERLEQLNKLLQD